MKRDTKISLGIVAVALVGIGILYIAWPSGGPRRIYVISAEAVNEDPCPPCPPVDVNPCPPAAIASPISMLFIENEPTLTYWVDGEKLHFREHEIPEHLR